MGKEEKWDLSVILSIIKNTFFKKENAFQTKEKGGIELFFNPLLPLKHKFYSDKLLW